MQLPHFASALAALALTASPAAAQDQIALGFAQTATQLLPAPFASYATLSTGERVVFDGLSVDLYDASNALLLHLGDVPAFVFASFVAVDPSETQALVGESSNGDLFRVALDGSGMIQIANVPFNFDCAFEDATTAWVSAATCGFGCGNDLVRVDTASGSTDFVVNVPGPSGPLAVHPDGRLFYATQSDQFPPPPGSTDVVYWTPAELDSGLPLGIGDATLFHPGLDGASSIAIDPVFGNVLVAEAVFMAPSRILELDGGGAQVAEVVVSPDFLASLELIGAPGVGHFHAFQPANGVFLLYGDGTEVRTVRPQRPLGRVFQNGPLVEFRVTGAVPDAAFLFTWGSSALYDPNETAYGIFGSFLYLSGLPLSAVRRQPFLTPTDGSGQGSFFLFDPGGLAGTLVFQALLTDASGTQFVGTSNSALY